MIDLAWLLCHETAPAGQWRYLVARVMLNDQLDCVTWPILPGARLHVSPAQAPAAPLPPLINPALVRASIVLDDQPLILPNLDHLAQAASPTAS